MKSEQKRNGEQDRKKKRSETGSDARVRRRDGWVMCNVRERKRGKKRRAEQREGQSMMETQSK